MALTGTKGLMVWCQRATEGYKDVKVVNMTTSFRDGLAFCAIIHHFRPDLIDFDSLSKENIWENNQLAFEVAEKELNIPSLLDPDDMVALPVPDKLSIMTYVSQYYNYFKNKKGAVELGIKPTSGVGRTTVKRPIEEVSPFKGKGSIVPVKKAFPANTCQVCGKKVYLVEKVVSNNKLYHRSCFKCKKCGDTLRPGAAKIGNDPSDIECQHHQDKIWNLRTNMSSRVKQSGNAKGASESVWEAQGTPQKLPWKKSKEDIKDSNDVKSDTTKSPSQKPPIPKNLPAKLLHPHLSSQSSARAQFFKTEPEPTTEREIDAKGEKNIKTTENVKKGLVTTLAGVMAREEEKKKLIVEESREKTKSKQTVNKDNASETEIPQKQTATPPKKEIKPDLPSTKPWESNKISNNSTPTSVSQRIEMFTQNNNQKELKITQKPDKRKEVIKEKDKEVQQPEIKRPEKVAADTKPIIAGKGGVLSMISRMEEESKETQVSGEQGTQEVLEVSEGSSQASEEISDLDKKISASEDEKQDTEKLEKDNGEKASNEKNGPINDQNIKEDTLSRKEDEGIEKEELDPDNPFFHSEDEAEEDEQTGKEEEGKMDMEVLGVERDNLIAGPTGLVESDQTGKISDVAVEINDDQLEKNGEPEGINNESLALNDDEDDTEKKNEESVNIDNIEDKTKSAIEKNSVKDADERTSISVTIPSNQKTEKSKDFDQDYDDSLNPFGSDDEDSSSSSDSDLGSNNPFADEYDMEDEQEDYDESLNPFGDSDDDNSYDSNVNPFTGSPISDTSFEFSPKVKPPPRPPPPKTSGTKKDVPKIKTREEILQEMQRARNTLKQKKRRAPNIPPGESPGSQGTPSPAQANLKAPPRSKKTRRAPLPPGTENGSDSSPTLSKKSLETTQDSSPSLRRGKSPKASRPTFKPPPQPSRMSKRRAPAPPPQKRDVRQHHVTPEEIQREIAEIEEKTKQMEKKGIELEDKLRAEMKDDTSEDSEELLMEWFEVVNEKNQLVRREGELVAQAQIQDLEIQHAEVEYEMRCLMHKHDHEKTDEDNQKEEELLELLVGLVQQRSTIVDRLEEDRIREQEEDETIRNMMQMKGKLLQTDSGLDRESIETKKEKKKKKKKKKHKEKHNEKEQ